MKWFALGFGFAVFFVVGCDGLPKRSLVNAVLDRANSIEEIALATPVGPLLKRVTTRKANPYGRILILEYHKLSGRNNDLNRTPAKFRQDLQTLYAQGYRPVTVSEWLANKMPLPPGASPVILTFDDSHPSQLRLKPDGSLDPNCFVGIWKDFAKTHPDFPVHGTFFILPPWPFGQAKHLKDKVDLLRKIGSEVGSHTYNHVNLAKCDDEGVKREIATSLDWLEKDFGVTNVPLAFPYGNKPRNMELLKGFTWNGKTYHLQAAFVAAGNPSEPIDDPKFDRWKIPRILASDAKECSTSWLKVMQTSKRFAPYVAP